MNWALAFVLIVGLSLGAYIYWRIRTAQEETTTSTETIIETLTTAETAPDSRGYIVAASSMESPFILEHSGSVRKSETLQVVPQEENIFDVWFKLIVLLDNTPVVLTRFSPKDSDQYYTWDNGYTLKSGEFDDGFVWAELSQANSLPGVPIYVFAEGINFNVGMGELNTNLRGKPLIMKPDTVSELLYDDQISWPREEDPGVTNPILGIIFIEFFG